MNNYQIQRVMAHLESRRDRLRELLIKAQMLEVIPEVFLQDVEELGRLLRILDNNQDPRPQLEELRMVYESQGILAAVKILKERTGDPLMNCKLEIEQLAKEHGWKNPNPRSFP